MCLFAGNLPPHTCQVSLETGQYQLLAETSWTFRVRLFVASLKQKTGLDLHAQKFPGLADPHVHQQAETDHWVNFKDVKLKYNIIGQAGASPLSRTTGMKLFIHATNHRSPSCKCSKFT